jgi:hypothetical protein
MVCDGMLVLYATFKIVCLNSWVINLVYFLVKVKKPHFPSIFIVCVWFSHRMFFMCFSPIQQTGRDNVRYCG